MATPTFASRVFNTLASIKTGIILLIVLVIVAAAGTVILQRPATDPDDLVRAYSPQTLLWLDRIGLTDVFHAWWFILLMAFLATTIVLASVERWPKAWKSLSRPYRKPEPHFRAVLPTQAKLATRNADEGLDAAERAFREAGLKPQEVTGETGTSLFAEKSRFAVLAVYVVHASLLLILTGGIVDALWGYKGYVQLNKNQSISELQLSNGARRALPFTLRCDGAGRENYPDGTPKKWWSKLSVLENGVVVDQKQIVVNDPLVRGGIRFYQSGYGESGNVDHLVLSASLKSDPKQMREITLSPDEPVQIDPNTTVKLVQFIPDFVIRDGQIYTRSNQPSNPAIGLAVETKNAKAAQVWVFPTVPDAPKNADSPYDFQLTDLKMAAFTGLQVSHEPGQWAVWIGCVLMALGLAMAFYTAHRRYWAMPVVEKNGALVLWLGTQADKNREHYEDEFQELVAKVREQLESGTTVNNEDFAEART